MDTSKRILVTGGAGFIGSHLCESLLSSGATVYCLDNLYTGKLKNITPLSQHDKFHFIEHDVTQSYDLPVDEIYHLASPASPIHYQRDPIQTSTTNYLGTLNFLQLAKKYQARFLLASTSEVYGNPLVHPQAESYFGNTNCYGPRSCYDESKRAAESLVYDFHHQYHVDTTIVRIFNTYGPKMCPMDGRVVCNFIVQALDNLPITIFGDGKQTRSLCHVNDMVTGLRRLMAASQIHDPVNIGNPEELSILDIATKILELTGSNSSLTYQSLPQDDPLQRRPDIQRAQKLLDWQPTVSLTDGLTQTVHYFKNLITEETSL